MKNEASFYNHKSAEHGGSLEAEIRVNSPVVGNVILVGTIWRNQSVAIGHELFYVSPPTTDFLVNFRCLNAGKVYGLPLSRAWSGTGKITALADMPMNDSIFLAKVELPVRLTWKNCSANSVK
ncbi:hypothetical protein [Spirosoma sp.]|uniref:hypothetical protein n=1 Tax=Spirosoma sp. TaxID=1899569 RepID=UPI0026366EBF|nr:hypothetical protein [Spirosoma sp.]MCX6217296.1 hypothetical protein [Spirosoma sp.]